MAYQAMTLGKLIETVKWQSEHAKDLRIDASKVNFVQQDDGLKVRLEFPDEIAVPTRHFLGQVREGINTTHKCDLRAGYWDACAGQTIPINGTDHNLLALQANHWLSKMETRHLVRCFTEDTGKPQMARAFLSNKYRRVDNFDLLVGILPELQKLQDVENFTIQSCSVGDDGGRFYLKFSCPKNRREFVIPGRHDRINEVVDFGVEIGNSETGDRSYYAIPWSFRLWCSNGAGHTEYGVRRNHAGRRISEEDEMEFSDDILKADDRVLMAKFVQIVKNCISDDVIANILADMSRAAGIPVMKPSKTVEVLKSKYQLRDAESDAILAAFTGGKDPAGLSLWGLANAVTATAQDKEVTTDYEDASRLEKLGGALLKLAGTDLRMLVEAK